MGLGNTPCSHCENIKPGELRHFSEKMRICAVGGRNLSIYTASQIRALRMNKDNSQDEFSSEKDCGKANPAHVIINLVPGPTSPAQKQAWRKFWAKLIAEVKRATMEDNSSDRTG